jgi:hypothetical protein
VINEIRDAFGFSFGLFAFSTPVDNGVRQYLHFGGLGLVLGRMDWSEAQTMLQNAGAAG